jgi:hypothetical protein
VSKYVDNPECFRKHGAQVHGLDCEIVSEDNRWWQAFTQVEIAITWDKAMLGNSDLIIESFIKIHADFADKAVAEARKRGRA